MTSLSRHEVNDIRGNWQMRLHVYPRVVLWNPFNVTLRFPKSMVMIQGNGRKEYYVASEDSRMRLVRQYVWLWSSRGEEINNGEQFWAAYESPYAGNIYFTVPETVFKPGECLVFSCARAMEYDDDRLETNLLSAEVAPDPGKNFYFFRFRRQCESSYAASGGVVGAAGDLDRKIEEPSGRQSDVVEGGRQQAERGLRRL